MDNQKQKEKQHCLGHTIDSTMAVSVARPLTHDTLMKNAVAVLNNCTRTLSFRHYLHS